MSLIRTLSLDRMRFGDYDIVPVNSISKSIKRPTFRSASASNRQPVVQKIKIHKNIN